MFFLIWGTKRREENLGIVADYCPECEAICVFLLRDIYSVGHIYWIPLGRGSLQATAKRCWDCRMEFYAHEDDYEEILPRESYGKISMQDMLERTNPRVAALIHNRMLDDEDDEPRGRRRRKEPEALENRNDMNAELWVRQAQIDAGETVDLRLGDGRTIPIRLNPNLEDGSRLRFAKMGFEGRGDLVVNLRVGR